MKNTHVLGIIFLIAIFIGCFACESDNDSDAAEKFKAAVDLQNTGEIYQAIQLFDTISKDTRYMNTQYARDSKGRKQELETRSQRTIKAWNDFQDIDERLKSVSPLSDQFSQAARAYNLINLDKVDELLTKHIHECISNYQELAKSSEDIEVRVEQAKRKRDTDELLRLGAEISEIIKRNDEYNNIDKLLRENLSKRYNVNLYDR